MIAASFVPEPSGAWTRPPKTDSSSGNEAENPGRSAARPARPRGERGEPAHDHRSHGVHLELEPGGDAEVAAAPAQGPKEVRVLLGARLSTSPYAVTTSSARRLSRPARLAHEQPSPRRGRGRRCRSWRPRRPWWPGRGPGSRGRARHGPALGAGATRPRVDVDGAHAERSIIRPPSQTALPATLWPPPRTAISSPCSRPKRTAAWTSAVPGQRAMRAGRRSIMPFRMRRARSYPASPGANVSPDSCPRSAFAVLSSVIMVTLHHCQR